MSWWNETKVVELLSQTDGQFHRIAGHDETHSILNRWDHCNGFRSNLEHYTVTYHQNQNHQSQQTFNKYSTNIQQIFKNHSTDTVITMTSEILLSREEQLAVWREEKKRKKKQGTSTNSSRQSQSSKQQQTPKLTPRLSLATSYSSIKKTPHRSVHKPSPVARSTGPPPRHLTPQCSTVEWNKQTLTHSRRPLSSLTNTSNNNHDNDRATKQKESFVSTRGRRKPLLNISPVARSSLGHCTYSQSRRSLGKPVRLSVTSVQNTHCSDQSDFVFLHDYDDDEANDDEKEEDMANRDLILGTYFEFTAQEMLSPLSNHSDIFHFPPHPESPYQEVTTIDKVMQPFPSGNDLFHYSLEERQELNNGQVAHCTNRMDLHVLSSPRQCGTEEDCSQTPSASSNQFGWQDDSPEEIVQKAMTRKRRADSNFLLLPTPSPLDTPTSMQVDHHAEIASNVKSNSNSLEEHTSSAINRISPTRGSNDILTSEGDDVDDVEISNTFLIHGVVKLNSVTILEPVAEIPVLVVESIHPPFPQAVSCTGCLDNGFLQERIQTLMMEKQTLENRLYHIRRSYEQRITPLRDVFEESRMLQMENLKLRAEQEVTQATITSLETQMMTGLNAAVAKSQLLHGMFLEAKKRNEDLEKELSILRIK